MKINCNYTYNGINYSLEELIQKTYNDNKLSLIDFKNAAVGNYSSKFIENFKNSDYEDINLFINDNINNFENESINSFIDNFDNLTQLSVITSNDLVTTLSYIYTTTTDSNIKEEIKSKLKDLNYKKLVNDLNNEMKFIDIITNHNLPINSQNTITKFKEYGKINIKGFTNYIKPFDTNVAKIIITIGTNDNKNNWINKLKVPVINNIDNDIINTIKENNIVVLDVDNNNNPIERLININKIQKLSGKNPYILYKKFDNSNIEDFENIYEYQNYTEKIQNNNIETIDNADIINKYSNSILVDIRENLIKDLLTNDTYIQNRILNENEDVNKIFNSTDKKDKQIVSKVNGFLDYYNRREITMDLFRNANNQMLIKSLTNLHKNITKRESFNSKYDLAVVDDLFYMLIEKNKDIDSTNIDDYNTPLIEEIEYKEFEKKELLLNPNLTTNEIENYYYSNNKLDKTINDNQKLIDMFGEVTVNNIFQKYYNHFNPDYDIFINNKNVVADLNLLTITTDLVTYKPNYNTYTPNYIQEEILQPTESVETIVEEVKEDVDIKIIDNNKYLIIDKYANKTNSAYVIYSGNTKFENGIYFINHNDDIYSTSLPYHYLNSINDGMFLKWRSNVYANYDNQLSLEKNIVNNVTNFIKSYLDKMEISEIKESNVPFVYIDKLGNEFYDFKEAYDSNKKIQPVNYQYGKNREVIINLTYDLQLRPVMKADNEIRSNIYLTTITNVIGDMIPLSDNFDIDYDTTVPEHIIEKIKDVEIKYTDLPIQYVTSLNNDYRNNNVNIDGLKIVNELPNKYEPIKYSNFSVNNNPFLIQKDNIIHNIKTNVRIDKNTNNEIQPLLKANELDVIENKDEYINDKIQRLISTSDVIDTLKYIKYLANFYNVNEINLKDNSFYIKDIKIDVNYKFNVEVNQLINKYNLPDKKDLPVVTNSNITVQEIKDNYYYDDFLDMLYVTDTNYLNEAFKLYKNTKDINELLIDNKSILKKLAYEKIKELGYESLMDYANDFNIDINNEIHLLRSYAKITNFNNLGNILIHVNTTSEYELKDLKYSMTERQNEIRDVVIDKNLLNKKLNSYSYLYNVNSGIELFNKLQQTGEIKAKCY